MATEANLSRLFDLSGKRVVVVGAGGGIGVPVCEGLAAHGAEVLCVDADGDAAGRAAAAAGRHAGRVRALRLRVESPADVDGLLAEAGPVDSVVSLFGMNVRRRIGDLSEEDFARVLAGNLTPSLFLMQGFGKALAENGGGSMVLFSSIRALTTEPGQGAYGAAKAGLLMLVKTLAAELGPAAVRVNAVAPSIVATEFTEPIRNDPVWGDAYARHTALNRWASPAEMVGATVFLVSDASSFVTGSHLLVDGGWTAIDGRFDPPI